MEYNLRITSWADPFRGAVFMGCNKVSLLVRGMCLFSFRWEQKLEKHMGWYKHKLFEMSVCI